MHTADLRGLFESLSAGLEFGALFGRSFTLSIECSRMNLLTFLVLLHGAWSAKRMIFFALRLFACGMRLERCSSYPPSSLRVGVEEGIRLSSARRT